MITEKQAYAKFSQMRKAFFEKLGTFPEIRNSAITDKELRFDFYDFSILVRISIDHLSMRGNVQTFLIEPDNRSLTKKNLVELHALKALLFVQRGSSDMCCFKFCNKNTDQPFYSDDQIGPVTRLYLEFFEEELKHPTGEMVI